MFTDKALFFPEATLGNGRKGFRRVILDEVQDLLVEGKEEKDLMLQLTQHAGNVWLVRALACEFCSLVAKAGGDDTLWIGDRETFRG